MTDHLLAATVDHLAAANWMFACVNTAEDDDPPQAPEPVPRPDGRPHDSSYDGSYDGSAAESGQGTAPAVDAPSPDALVRFFG